MSKEHAYAYEAGYRDGSINYELEHCPACKNVADLQEALAENAKLREELADAPKCETCEAMLDCDECLRADGSHKERRRLSAENAKLRELVRDLWKACPADGYYCIYHCEHYDKESESHCKLEDRMRELGVDA